MYKVLKNESDFDDWIRVLPDEASVVSTQTAVKNSLKEVLQRFDTAYGKERRIEADLGGFAIVLFGDRTEVSEQEKNVLKCGGAVFVKNSITEVETCKQYLTLYFDSGDGKRRTILFPREDLVENKIVSLTAYGVQVSKKTADYLIKSIENQEVNVKHLLCHAKLGMAEWNGEKIFKGAKGVGIDSKYTGKLRVSPKGTYANYKKMLKQDVIGHTPMEFLLSASISGLLVDYLKESISVENIMVHMIGESSTGKTTGALLAVSCGSAPDFLGNNFVFSFQDTLNSLMRLIPNSYPTLIDEGKLEKALLRVYYCLVEVMFVIRSTSRNWSQVKTPLWSIEENRNLVENR